MRIDAGNLATQIQRLQDTVGTDPRSAIGTAKELVETVCKTILADRGKTVDTRWNAMELAEHARDELKLAPDDIPDATEAAKSIKRLLSNLTTIVRGLAELRNAYGTGHGPDGRAKGLGPPLARLAASAGCALARFLFDTREERP